MKFIKESNYFVEIGIEVEHNFFTVAEEFYHPGESSIALLETSLFEDLISNIERDNKINECFLGGKAKSAKFKDLKIRFIRPNSTIIEKMDIKEYTDKCTAERLRYWCLI